jgi:glycosyl hydrolase family 12
MHKVVRSLVVSMTVVAAVATSAGVASAATWSSSDKWATWSNGGYTVRNDVWGSGAGPQSIWANSYSNFGVWSDQPNTGGVKTYPHSAKNVNKQLSALSRVSSSFNVSRPGSGAYETAYDIWANNNAYEIMLWMNKQGAVGPLGSKQTTASVGGHTWDVYKGSNGSNAVFSFVRTSGTNAGTVDVLAVLNWIKARGWYGDVTLGEVQFGFEITSSAGGLNFTTNSYSVTAS